MRYLAIGDIHGCFVALYTLMDSIGLQPDDVVITLGDYVGKGKNVAKVLDWLVDFKSKNNLVALKGNHEIFMLNARNNCLGYEMWLACGGSETMGSYGNDIDNIPDSHWDFLEKCLPFYELDRHFFVHANAYYNMPLSEQPIYKLCCEKLDTDSIPHQSGKIMICGHTSQKNGEPLDLEHAICIDTWAYGAGWLTCLDVLARKYWQANEQGQTRTGYL